MHLIEGKRRPKPSLQWDFTKRGCIASGKATSNTNPIRVPVQPYGAHVQ